jgi:hypothetical protein
MREIDLSSHQPPKRTTVLSYGQMRSGKTRWAATWPRPLFLSDATEGGWTTIKNMDRNVLWEPDVVPRVWAIDTAADMMQALGDVEPLIKQNQVQTLVIDSLTFYNDLYLAMLCRVAAQGGRQPDMRRVYGNLGQHLRELRIRVHNLDTNVVWLCLAKQPDDSNPMGGPMISGQQAQKFSAGCDYILYHRAYQPTPNDPHYFEIRTRRYSQYAAGGRDEFKLPDPLAYVSQDAETGEDIWVGDCTYRTFAEALGLLTPPTTQQQPAGQPVGVGRAPNQASGKAALSSR